MGWFLAKSDISDGLTYFSMTPFKFQYFGSLWLKHIVTTIKCIIKDIWPEFWFYLPQNKEFISNSQQNVAMPDSKHANVKESFSFKTRMPGTVKCRPTVAYWVQIDSINIATELITRYYLNDTLIQCCFNVRPTSATLAQHWTNIR